MLVRKKRTGHQNSQQNIRLGHCVQATVTSDMTEHANKCIEEIFCIFVSGMAFKKCRNCVILDTITVITMVGE